MILPAYIIDEFKRQEQTEDSRTEIHIDSPENIDGYKPQPKRKQEESKEYDVAIIDFTL
jgi:hypothetical protein